MHNVTNYFVSPSKQTTHVIFNREHAIVNPNNIYQIHGNPSTFTRVRGQIDDIQTNGAINTFKLCWRVKK